jgi:hypothetical protein
MSAMPAWPSEMMPLAATATGERWCSQWTIQQPRW